MLRYDILTCGDIDDFTAIKCVSLIVLKFVGVSSKHLRVFLESLRQSLEAQKKILITIREVVPTARTCGTIRKERTEANRVPLVLEGALLCLSINYYQKILV